MCVRQQRQVNEKFTIEQAMKRVEVYLYLFCNLGARWGGWSTPGPGRFTPWQREPVTIVQESWCVTGSLWTAAKNLPTPGLDPQAVQPVL